jgi:hypothetical protein
MIDTVLSGTGNSRYLKSSISAGTTWEDFLALIQAGTLPIDFNGINSANMTVKGTELNKANLMSDATASAIATATTASMTAASTINEALAAIAAVVGINAPQVATASYVGTGTFGADSSSSITLDFTPKIGFVTQASSSALVTLGIFVNPSRVAHVLITRSDAASSVGQGAVVTWNTAGLTWHSLVNATYQLNASGQTANYTFYG